jgi:hypothetical protein
MAELMTQSNVMFAIGILGVIFTVYNYFRNPQINQDKKDALLAQQIQWMIEGTDRRFKTTQESFQQLILQSNNHIHTIDVKVDGLNHNVCSMENEITKLSTVIDERIPKQK